MKLIIDKYRWSTYICVSFSGGKMKHFKDVLLHHQKHYPLMKPRDLYKLVFSCAMGPGHAVEDAEMAKKLLDLEISGLLDYDDAGMTDVVSLETGLVRVNIRPFLKYGGKADDLCRIFVGTANTFQSDRSKIRKLWKVAEELHDEGSLSVNREEMNGFFLEMESKSFPAAHHSETYRENYRPAYRVVYKKYLDAVIPKK